MTDRSDIVSSVSDVGSAAGEPFYTVFFFNFVLLIIARAHRDFLRCTITYGCIGLYTEKNLFAISTFDENLDRFILKVVTVYTV